MPFVDANRNFADESLAHFTGRSLDFTLHPLSSNVNNSVKRTISKSLRQDTRWNDTIGLRA